VATQTPVELEVVQQRAQADTDEFPMMPQEVVRQRVEADTDEFPTIQNIHFVYLEAAQQKQVE
jgi:hypothetical protein